MKTCLILDTETTGLDPNSDSIIEIGAILYSIEHQTPLVSLSFLLEDTANPCEHINKIPAKALSKTLCESSAGDMLAAMEEQADCYVAHNAAFDSAFLKWEGKPWVCTKDDFSWPGHEHINGKSLVHIALEHGIGVSNIHRALADCQLIAALFDRCDDLPAMFARAMRPKAMFKANVSYDDRQLAKDAGFQWNPDSKSWTRSMAIEDAAQLSFPVQKI